MEVFLAKGMSIPQVCRKLGVTEQTYYRWRKEYGGVRTDQVKWIKELGHRPYDAPPLTRTCSWEPAAQGPCVPASPLGA